MTKFYLITEGFVFNYHEVLDKSGPLNLVDKNCLSESNYHSK